MELIHLVIVAVSIGCATAQNSTCDPGYWGPKCENFCGYCYSSEPTSGPYNRYCDPNTGACNNGCQGDYTGIKCDEPVCDDCNGGECIAPGVCGNCPDISHVSPGCTNIKLRGLLGSLTAFGVLIFSLISCALGSILYERRKNTSVSL